jgi:hypothetical protein
MQHMPEGLQLLVGLIDVLDKSEPE